MSIGWVSSAQLLRLVGKVTRLISLQGTNASSVCFHFKKQRTLRTGYPSNCWEYTGNCLGRFYTAVLRVV